MTRRELNLSQGELAGLGHLKEPMLKVIRKKCLDCVCHVPSEVRQCTAAKSCALWPYRLGKNPWKSPRHLSPARVEALAVGRRARLDKVQGAQEGEVTSNAQDGGAAGGEAHEPA